MSCCLSRALELARATKAKSVSGVPKVIHQTWKSYDVPSEWASSMHAWTTLHPDWTYILWTDDDIEYYMKTSWPNDYDFFKSLPWTIQRIDVWRYYALRDFGGIYCDLDIEPLKNIEQFITTEPIQLVPSANAAGVFTNALMISTTSKTSKLFWTLIIDGAKAYSASHTLGLLSAASRHLEIMESTGPLALTRAANDFAWPITVLPRRLWNPYDLSLADLPSEQRNEQALVKLLPGSSWHEADSSFLSFLLIYKAPIVLFAILIMVLYVIKSELVKTKLLRLLKRFNRA
jgi:mannosyltransferase OCH1-like enzyme